MSSVAAFALPSEPVVAARVVSPLAEPSYLLRGSALAAAETPAAGTQAKRPAAFAAAAAVAATGALAAGRHRRRNAAAAARRRGVRQLLRVATLEKPMIKEENGKILREDLRNIAIIAHVDHGKTTLTDALMKQTREENGGKEQASMDSNQIESERGITILAKNAALTYKGVKVNIIDTPGHADFGGEVERILNMADACLLLVDAQEGPMPQTKFVLRKALELKKKVIVCINKVDKPSSRPDWVLDTTFDLFVSLGASDELCEFPVVYASGFNGVASRDCPTKLEENLFPILDLVLEEVPSPVVDKAEPLQMLISNLDYDDYMGRISIGRVVSGGIKVGQEVGFMYGEDGEMRKATISKLWEFKGNSRSPVEEVMGGDICAFTGMDDVTIGDTVVDINSPKALPPIEVEEPTVIMEFGVNLSPLAGQEKKSTKLTSTMIKNRLEKEVLTNLALRVEPGSTSESFKVKGRGTLQLGILIENMRREGFELLIGAPKVILRQDPETGKKQEPYEEAVIEVPTEYQGVVLEEMQKKAAVMKTMEPGSIENSVVMTFEIPTSKLIGMQGKFMSRTKGTAVLNSRFSHWGEHKPETKLRDRGSVVATASGKATTYALLSMKTRGSFFIEPAEEVYEGMCVGIHNKETDIEINISKEKKVTNVRAQGTAAESIPPKVQMSIDDYLGHMDTDEMLEVTPGPLRLLKKNSKALKKR